MNSNLINSISECFGILQGQESRRCSNITCCSSESSYLERRCSAITLGLTPLPPISSRCPSTTDMWDYFAIPAPAIQVIEATPKTSPCPSERNEMKMHENVYAGQQRRRRKPQKSLSEQDSFDLIAVYPDSHRTQPHYYDEFEEDELAETAALAQQINKLTRDNRCLDDSIITSTVNNTLRTSLLLNRRAPLASLSSLKISSVDNQDSDLHSLASDSIFAGTEGHGGDGGDSAPYADTDDDMEQFSTDSDAISENGQHIAAVGMQRIPRSSKANALRSSIVCADIELKPRELLANETIEKPKSFGTKMQPKASKDCMLTQPLTAMAMKRSEDGKMARGNENGSQTVMLPLALTQKRPASYAGLGKDDGTSSCSSTIQTNDGVNNNDNSNNNKTKQLFLSSGNNNTRCSRSTGNMADDALHQRQQQHQHLPFSTFSSPILPSSIHAAAPPSHHHHQQQHSYYEIDVESIRQMPNQSPFAAQNINQSADDIVDITSSCRQRQSSSIVNPSVILELPVIVSPHDSTVIETEPITFDPSLPGPSRKWSKETLF